MGLVIMGMGLVIMGIGRLMRRNSLRGMIILRRLGKFISKGLVHRRRSIDN